MFTFKILVYVFLTDLFKGSTLPNRTYLINVGLTLILILQITFALVYQLLSLATRNSKSFSGDLTESLSFKPCLAYYSIFLILKIINPLMFPVHWQMLSGRECSISGAYELPKVAKEHATTMYTWVPSKYKFEPAPFPYKESVHLLVVTVMQYNACAYA